MQERVAVVVEVRNLPAPSVQFPVERATVQTVRDVRLQSPFMELAGLLEWGEELHVMVEDSPQFEKVKGRLFLVPARHPR